MSRLAAVALLVALCACTEKRDLEKLCAADPQPAAGDRNASHAFTAFFAKAQGTARTPAGNQVIGALAHTNPMDGPTILANAVKDVGIDHCALLDKLNDAYTPAPVTGCMKGFGLAHCKLTSVSPELPAAWAALPADPERYLELQGVTDADLAVVGKLSSLRMLAIVRSPKVTELAPLAGLAHLRHLTVFDTGVTNVRAVAAMPELKYLDIYENHALTSLAGVEALTLLVDLSCRGTAVVDITPLLKLPKLSDVQLPHGVPDAQLQALKAANPKLRVLQSPK